MSPLESRKHLLVAESELNRAQLLDDLGRLATTVHALANHARSLGAIASPAAALMAGLATFQRAKPAAGDTKPARWAGLLKGAGLISTLWWAIRARRRERP